MPAHPILRSTYYPDTLTLEIAFATGKLHSFAPVPSDVAEAMRRSSAKVLFFTHRIRGRFPVIVSETGGILARPHGDAQLV